MSVLNLKPTHQIVKSYYQEIHQLNLLDKQSEGAVSPAFAALLRHCAHQYNWTLVEQYAMQRGTKTIRLDGADEVPTQSVSTSTTNISVLLDHPLPQPLDRQIAHHGCES